MASTIDVDHYLARIDYTGSTIATSETLRGLHRAHLLAVPFENLDIHLGRPIELDEARLIEKIVTERRGGFCYELNASFAALLRGLGYRVSLLSAGVATPDGRYGPEFDHLLLRVDLDEPWIADVGFGDCFLEPLRLSGGTQSEDGRAFQIKHEGDRYVLLRRDGDGDWAAQYRFTLIPRDLSDFASMCHYHQTSEDSHFTRNRICSRATPSGRISLTGDRLIVADNGRRHESAIPDDAAYADALRHHFGIVLPMPKSID